MNSGKIGADYLQNNIKKQLNNTNKDDKNYSNKSTIKAVHNKNISKGDNMVWKL